MTYEIHYTLPGGSEDSVILEADTVDRLRDMADAHVARVGGFDPWSRRVQP